MILKRPILVLVLLLIFQLSLGQSKPKRPVVFTQKDLNAYKTEENKYDLHTKESLNYYCAPGDTASCFFNPSRYKGILNYGVDFALRDKRNFTFLENYEIYYTDVIFEKCTLVGDNILEVEAHLEGGWNTVDFKGGPPPDFVEVSSGQLRKDNFVVHLNMERYNIEKLKIGYKGQEKIRSFALDTLPRLSFEKLDFKKRFNTSHFSFRVIVDKNTTLAIGKLSCFVHLYHIGEMVFAPQKKAGVAAAKKPKDAPRFQKIIANNVQVNNPDNPKKETLPYYELTEKAETLLLTKQYAKAKALYAELAASQPGVYARDIHNAIRVCLLSRDVQAAFWWAEKLAAKDIAPAYFNARIFNGMKKNPQWKSFSVKYDSIRVVSQSRQNAALKQLINDLLNEDQADYGLENRKEPEVLYETTQRVTTKLIELLQKEGYPSEEKIGAFTRNDTTLIQSPAFHVVIRHAVQQKSKGLDELNEILYKSQASLEFDLKRSGTHRNFPGACFHIYKGNLYIDKSCDYNSQAMVRKMVFMFNNPHAFIIDNGDFIVSEYNKESPQEWDEYYENRFNLVVKLTDDWEFYEK